ncbi:c-type cytochrome [Rubrolithibacter danxiaensis]|uniref:c-type cytochrome n=1 Tax=Rubrolithibacter danxiaensis TaxID=3390805 RepID=UPI003BF79041
MKKAGKILVFIFISIFIIVGALVSYVKFALPNVGKAPDLKVELTPARIERGKYLANHVTVCIDCHSKRDWTKLGGPLDPQTTGSGGEKFDSNVGFPGEVYSANITPFNLKNWTDGEIFRAITTGVKKDGSAIFPIMPYNSYRQMDKEDIYSIIAYIRTLPERKSTFPERKLDFPLNFIVNTIPTKADLKPIPNEKDQLAYGAYILNAAACKECHTKAENGNPVEGMELAGGRDFQLPSGTVFSANLTPDPETGIGKWTREQFVAKFQMFADSSYRPANVGAHDFQTIMPWGMYGGMKKSDLEAIYAYLKTVKPVKNEVTRFVTSKELAAVK